MVSQTPQDLVNELIGAATSLMVLGLAVGVVRAISKGLAPSPGPELLPQVHYCEKQCSHCDLMQVIPKEQLLHILLRGSRPDLWPAVRIVPPPGRPGAPPPPGVPVVRRRVLIEEEEARQIHQLYATLKAEGYAPTAAMKVVADRMGHSLSTIWRVLHREIRPPVRRLVTPERLQEVVGLRRLGLPSEQIGRRLGFTRAYISYLLHQAGEELDIAAEAQRLNDRLYAVSRGLWPPATISKLTAAALETKAVADEVAVLQEIAPGEEVKFQLGTIHGRALLAEEVLHNGVWCLRASEMAELPLSPPPPVPGYLGRPMGVPRPIAVTARLKRLLKACGETARYAARGIIQGWPEYQERISEVLVESPVRA